MTGINFLGSYSGIDQGMVDQLMEVEKLPLIQLANKKATLTSKQNAWRDINTRLNTLFEKVKALQNDEIYFAKSASSTNQDIVTMTASKNAAAGNYKIHVETLATNTSIISGTISLAEGDSNKALGITGSFGITNADGKSAEITVAAEDTLKTIADKINAVAKDTNISATIIDSRLVITDEKTGNRNISLTGDGKGTLTSLGLNMAAKTVQQGTDARFTINGVEVQRSTNTITDVVEFVTINLNKEHAAGEYDTVKVTLDTSKLTKAIQDFVDQYNSTMTFIEGKLAAGDPEVEGSKGTLAGDSSLMRLHSSLRRYVTDSLFNGNTDIKDISQLGVSTIDKYGQLKFDASKLQAAFSENRQNVMNFFISKDNEGNDIGFSTRLKDYIDSFISSNNGIIKGKTESYDEALKNLNEQIDNFNARMERKEEYYIKMFSALDVALMQAESQMSWLQGQIEFLSGSNKK